MENLIHTAKTVEDMKVKLDILYDSRQGHGCCCGSTLTPAPHGPVFRRMATLAELDDCKRFTGHEVQTTSDFLPHG
ncbi:hypothetical protein SprV_0902711500 [Sparganum proliferum]